MAVNIDDVVIGILGGTGDQGRGLAYRFALAGFRVIVGSRSADRARSAAAELTALAASSASAPAGTPAPAPAVKAVEGMTNADMSRAASLVIAAVPWEGHGELLGSLAVELTGKIVVDCVNPLGFDSRGAYALPVPEGSAAQQAAALLPSSRVVAAFHHVSAKLLLDPGVETVDLDILVLGDDREATDLVQELAGRIPGMRGVYAGRLRNAGQIEALTANLVSVNRRYKAHAGIRITDI
ncbi:MAG TPA: NADPH-dependent F420 reductase [Streptosporangiaceae bacterium]|nr:NADPH-dependent F420 reductase [Streptosporangiaceae bacterium]